VNGVHGRGPLAPGRVDAYLARIDHPQVRDADAATLASLQDAHVRSVPFENLDIHLGVPLTLDIGGLFAKVVERRRGGFCFELNGLFHALLISLGYEAWLVEARQLEEDGTLGPRFDHARILTVLDGETLLVDVGNGASPRGPIRLVEDEQVIGGQHYRVRRLGERLISDRLTDGAWQPGWVFDTEPRELSDFTERCHYHQHAPESHFTQKPLCSIVTEHGQVTLSDRTLIVTEDGERSESTVDDPLRELEHRFGVTIPRWPGG
jgi:N-hydroxyarylamine O-acetyltransferase